MAIDFKFLKKKPFWFRWDIFPFLFIYPFVFNPSINRIKEAWIFEEPDSPSNSTFAFLFDHVDVEKLQPHTFQVMFPIVLVLIHVIILLAPNWSIKLRVKFWYQETGSNDASHVAFFPKPHHGTSGIVEYQKGNPSFVIFQQKKREYIDGKFVSLKYPTNMKVGQYLTHKGLTDKEAEEKIAYFGPNSYQLPIPGFLQLFKEQLVSPLFVFQIFSILCLMVDEYWTYPLMSLGSLLFMEFSNVKTRQSNLLELRGAEVIPVPLYVLRAGKWRKIPSDLLAPGDIILIESEFSSPCDLLVLNGRVVVNEAMLTGESTPQLKDPVSTLPSTTQFDVTKHRRHVLFSGTQIEQLIPAQNESLPVVGVVCFVLSTGLGSAQGRLLRTILFASERVTSDSRDSLSLLSFLSIFAVLAAGYVVYHGKKSGTIHNFRLIVEALIIITSTIPPDLPMQLSFQVNASLLALSKLSVFCTEPFRIPYAGMVSVCCFDKTGTLTAEEYKLIGVDNLDSPPSPKRSDIVGNYYSKDEEMPIESMWVIGGCHSLVRGNYGALIGDSVEEAAFTSMRFKLNPDKSSDHPRCRIVPVKEYHFSSDLRRMTVVAEVSEQTGFIALTKGAPEIIAELSNNITSDYYPSLRKYTKQGCRVLAMAYRKLGDSYDPQTERTLVEKNLTFIGFCVFSAAIKRGSEDTVAGLLKSTHRVIVITGDDPLTACHVAKRLHIINKQPAIHDLTITDENGDIVRDDSEYSLCYTGRCLQSLTPDQFSIAVRKCNVFARMSPQDKASVVIALNELGEKTLMCGDGTNDVGALKHAHVGVGLLESSIEEEEVNPLSEEGGYKPKRGAASIASPFVSKRPTISSCIDLIRFGRATLSSTLDLFKQLSVNCLITAYSMSVLYIENVKNGDRQMTIFSMVMMIASMSIAWAKPTRKLSKERPFPSQFNSYLVFSVLFQFGIHCLFLYLTHQLVFGAGYKLDKFNIKARFTPNLLNTALFIISGEMQIVTILCNYRGSPFMQSFSENRMLLVGVIVAGLLICVLLADIHPWIRKQFQLVQYPTTSFQLSLALYCALDAIICFIGERFLLSFFSRKNRETVKGLVEPSIQADLAGYITNDDDMLPDDLHDFGLMEMMKQNMLMQKKIKDKEAKMNMTEMLKLKQIQEVQRETNMAPKPK